MSRRLAWLVLWATAGTAAGADVVIAQAVDDDLYAAGRRVELRSPVNGDAVVAGQAIAVTAPVRQDLIAAGELVTVDAPVGDDVRVAGREVRLGQAVAGHLVAAGESVTLLPGARVDRFAWLFGRDIVLQGEVGGDLRVAGESVRLSGRVRGNAEIRARRLELLPGARIDGDLRWSGAERHLDERAQVGGRVTEEPRPAEERHGAARAAAVGALFIGAWALAGLVLYLLFPRAAEALAATVWTAPWQALALGFAALVVTPVLVLLLFATAIGWLLALILLALYLIALPTGGLAGTYALAHRVLGWSHKATPRRAARAALFAAAVVVVALLHLVPLLGWVLALGLLSWGLGALLRLASRARPA